MTEHALWKAYAAGDETARERLLAEHMNLVYHLAHQMYRRLAGELELDELISAGTIGLVDALERFEPARGFAFSTYAVPRVRGAMLDEVRRLDSLPSSVRRRVRMLGVGNAALANRLGRAPRSSETAAHLGVDTAALWRWQTEAEAGVYVGLDAASGLPVADALTSSDASDVEERLTLDQEIAILRDALRNLTTQERTVLTLSYFEELTLKEIAQVLEVTESRISQIRTKALAKLREELAPLRALVA